jgi:hypothetical protein
MALAVRREPTRHNALTGRDGDDLVFGRTPRAPFIPSTSRSRARKAWKAAKLEPILLREARHRVTSDFIPAGLDWEQISLGRPRRRVPGLERAAEVPVEQVHVRPGRERRRVMAEPVLHLHRVAAGGQHARRGRVAKRVKASPLDARLLARRHEHAGVQVMRVWLTPQTIRPRGGAQEPLDAKCGRNLPRLSRGRRYTLRRMDQSASADESATPGTPTPGAGRGATGGQWWRQRNAIVAGAALVIVVVIIVVATSGGSSPTGWTPALEAQTLAACQNQSNISTGGCQCAVRWIVGHLTPAQVSNGSEALGEALAGQVLTACPGLADGG